MPKTISEYFARSRFRLDEFQYNPRVGFGAERSRYPINLLVHLPTNNVEMSRILIGKNESHEIVVVVLVIDVKGPFEIDSSELIRPLTWTDK